MSENKDLREEQNKRRAETGEPPTLESMLKDLIEEAEDMRTDNLQREMLQGLLALEKKTRCK